MKWHPSSCVGRNGPCVRRRSLGGFNWRAPPEILHERTISVSAHPRLTPPRRHLWPGRSALVLALRTRTCLARPRLISCGHALRISHGSCGGHLCQEPQQETRRGPAGFEGALGKDIPRWQEPERVGLDQARLGGKKEAIALTAHHRGTKILDQPSKAQNLF